MGWNWKGELTVQVSIDSPDSLLASLLSGNEPGRLILVSGPSGSGKTRWCQALAEQANSRGIHAGGLISPAVFKGNHKVGIDMLDLGSGARRRLAVARGKTGEDLITGKWHFDNQTLDWGNEILAHSGACPLFILDELGPLEFEQGVGLTNGIELITARQYQLACVVVRPSLLEIAAALWPWGEIFQTGSSHPREVPV
jgi:nucleoside-triphosphatase THEP1